MPYRRSYRRPIRKRRYTRKRKSYYRPMVANRFKKKRNQVTNAVFRNWENATIQNTAGAGTGVPTAGHLARALSDMNGCSPYINLFSQYRVRKVKYQFIPLTGEKAITDSSKAVTAIRPMFATAINRVASSFPQDGEQIMTMMSGKWTSAGRYHERYFKPVTFDSVYRAFPSGSNAFNPEYDQWISTNMANVSQHGLSYVMESAGDLPTGYYKYRVITTMYCQFKNRRVNTDNVASQYTEQSEPGAEPPV